MTFKSIAIIGGGPAGISAAKALSEEPYDFQTIDLYERQTQLGGIWNYTPKNKKLLKPSVPHYSVGAGSSSYEAPDDHNSRNLENNGYLSPLYEHLETNVPKTVMEFKDTPFPDAWETFPSRNQVTQYIHNYADTIDKEKINIRLNSKVENVEKSADSNIWNVTVYDYLKDKTYTSQYDAVIVCNGHFDTPFIPDVEGLKEWNTRNKDSIIHAKFYNNPTEYVNKNVLVVGNSYSGVDITTQLLTVANKVYLSSNNSERTAIYKNSHFNYVDTIAKYNDDNSVITTTGEVYKDIHKIVFATGYLYDIPFLSTYKDQLIDQDGKKIKNLYKDIFFINDPSLIFVDLNNEVLPNPFSEAQAAYIARVLSGRLQLPSLEQLKQSYKERLEQQTTEKPGRYHYLVFPKDIDYIETLQSIVDSVDDAKGGATSIKWPAERRELRKNCLKIKQNRLDKIVSHALKLRDQGIPFYLLRDTNVESISKL